MENTSQKRNINEKSEPRKVVSRQDFPKVQANKSPNVRNGKLITNVNQPVPNTAAEKSQKLAFRRYLYKTYTRPSKVASSSLTADQKSANGGLDSHKEETKADSSAESLSSQRADRRRMEDLVLHLNSLLYPDIKGRAVNEEGIQTLTIVTRPSKMLPLLLDEMRSDPLLRVFKELFDIFIGSDIDLEPETTDFLFPELPAWVDYLLGNAFKETVEQIHPHLKDEWIFHCHNKLSECFTRFVEDDTVIHSKSIGRCIGSDSRSSIWMGLSSDLMIRGETRWARELDFPFLVIESRPKFGSQSSAGSHKVTMLLAKAYQHQVDLLSQVDLSKVDPIVCMPLVFGMCFDGRHIKVSLYRVIKGVKKNCYCFPPLNVMTDMKRILRIFACIKTTALAIKKSFDSLDLL